MDEHSCGWADNNLTCQQVACSAIFNEPKLSEVIDMKHGPMLGRHTALMAVLVFLCLPPPTSAQDLSWGGTLGVGRPGIPFFGPHFHDGLTGAGRERLGPFVSAFSEWSPSSSPVTVRTELFYNRLTTAPNSAYVIDGELVPLALLDEVLGLDLGIIWPQTGRTGGGPYLVGGPSVLANRLGTNPLLYLDEVTDVRWSYGLGVHFGAGVAFGIGGLRTGIELKYHQGLFEGRGSGWGSLMVPLRFW